MTDQPGPRNSQNSPNNPEPYSPEYFALAEKMRAEERARHRDPLPSERPEVVRQVNETVDKVLAQKDYKTRIRAAELLVWPHGRPKDRPR